MTQITLEKYDCDRCGFTYKKSILRRQRGMLLCADCRDNLKKLKTPNPRWMSPRENSDTTTAVNSPTVFEISAATGITALSQSREYDNEGSRRHFKMRVVSDGGAITVTASPPIVAGIQGDTLTLTGTSDTDTITFTDLATLNLRGDEPFTLSKGDTLSFVFNTITTTDFVGWGSMTWGSSRWGTADIPTESWVETSRNKGGL